MNSERARHDVSRGQLEADLKATSAAMDQERARHNTDLKQLHATMQATIEDKAQVGNMCVHICVSLWGDGWVGVWVP